MSPLLYSHESWDHPELVTGPRTGLECLEVSRNFLSARLSRLLLIMGEFAGDPETLTSSSSSTILRTSGCTATPTSSMLSVPVSSEIISSSIVFSGPPKSRMLLYCKALPYLAPWTWLLMDGMVDVLFVEFREFEAKGKKLDAPGKSLMVIDGKNELDFDIFTTIYDDYGL